MDRLLALDVYHHSAAASRSRSRCGGVCAALSEWSSALHDAARRRSRTAGDGPVARAGEAERQLVEDAPGLRLHDDDAVGQRHRLLHVVGDEHDGRARLLPQAEQMLVQARAGEGVERRERLVEEQHLRVRSRRRGRSRRAAAGRRRDRAASGSACSASPTLSSACATRGRRSARGRRRGRSRHCRRRSARAAGAAPGRRCRWPDAARRSPRRRGGSRRRSPGRGRRSGAAAWSCRSPSRRSAPTISPSRTSSVDVGRARACRPHRSSRGARASSITEPSPARVLPAHQRLRRAATSRLSAALPSSAKAMMAARIWSGLPICCPSTSR